MKVFSPHVNVRLRIVILAIFPIIHILALKDSGECRGVTPQMFCNCVSSLFSKMSLIEWTEITRKQKMKKCKIAAADKFAPFYCSIITNKS